MTTIDRGALYDLVWNEPVREVAARFGVSDTALKKQCSSSGIAVSAFTTETSALPALIAVCWFGSSLWGALGVAACTTSTAPDTSTTRVIALLGRNIRRRRNALGISQEELAFRAEMKRSYVSGIELGNRKPSVEALERLADALCVDPRSLLDPDRYMKWHVWWAANLDLCRSSAHMDVVALLGRNVRVLRTAADLSQEELAFRASMKRSYLSDLERGTRNPSVRALGRLAAALDVPPSRLLE